VRAGGIARARDAIRQSYIRAVAIEQPVYPILTCARTPDRRGEACCVSRRLHWGLILTVGAGIVGTILDYYEPGTHTARYNTARYICAAAVLIGFALMAGTVPH
jgi:hypothetical protein